MCVFFSITTHLLLQYYPPSKNDTSQQYHLIIHMLFNHVLTTFILASLSYSSQYLNYYNIHRLHDLAEEMETLNAEFDLNKVRLEEESRKLAKVSADNSGAVENKGRRSKAKANTNEADALLMELLGKKATAELGLDKPIVKVFANLASSLIDSRVKSNIHSATILDLQCQLDDKVCVLLLPVPVTL